MEKMKTHRAKYLVLGVLLLILLLPVLLYIFLSTRVKMGIVISSDIGDSYKSLCLSGMETVKNERRLREDRLMVVELSNSDDCYYECVSLAEAGCNMIVGFGDGIEDGLVQSATEYSKIQFFTAYGEQEKNGLSNYHCFSPMDFQSRYIAGVVAGGKLNDMVENGEITADETILGYVAEFRNSENISAYTAFYLGAKSVCDTAVLNVQYLFSENDLEVERRAIMSLIANGCKLITKQSESFAESQICIENDVYYIGYLETESEPSNYYLTSSNTDIGCCLSFLIDTMKGRNEITGSFSVPMDSVDDFLADVNECAFSNQKRYEETMQKVNVATESLLDESLHVFATDTWTIDGKMVETTVTDELLDVYYGTEYISPHGYFMENELSALPKFEFIIDGITELNYTDNQDAEIIGG